jgi:hypothetical protein
LVALTPDPRKVTVPPGSTETLMAGASMEAIGVSDAAATVTVRVTAGDASPRLSTTVKLAVNVPAAL